MQCLMYHDERCFALEEAVKEASDMRLVSAGGVAACPQGLQRNQVILLRLLEHERPEIKRYARIADLFTIFLSVYQTLSTSDISVSRSTKPENQPMSLLDSALARSFSLLRTRY